MAVGLLASASQAYGEVLERHMQIGTTRMHIYASSPGTRRILDDRVGSLHPVGSQAFPDHFIIVAAEDAVIDGHPQRQWFSFLSNPQFEDMSSVQLQSSGCSLIQPFSSNRETAVLVVVHRVRPSEDFDGKVMSCVYATMINVLRWR